MIASCVVLTSVLHGHVQGEGVQQLQHGVLEVGLKLDTSKGNAIVKVLGSVFDDRDQVTQ
jgi:hypothetical protein